MLNNRMIALFDLRCYRKNEVVSKRWHNLIYILSSAIFSFGYVYFFLMHLATSCYIPIISGYK